MELFGGDLVGVLSRVAEIVFALERLVHGELIDLANVNDDDLSVESRAGDVLAVGTETNRQC